MQQDLKKKVNFSWYPGHMLKAERELKQRIGFIDFVILVIDARAPQGTQNSHLISLIRNKPKLLILNKADLADPDITALWLSYFRRCNKFCISTKKSSPGLAHKIFAITEKALGKKINSQKVAYPGKKTIRIMILGMPNVGKSTIINKILTQKKVITGPQPGVTRGQQWIKLSNTIELLDTPGVMVPKISSLESAFTLSFLKIIKGSFVPEESILEFIFPRLSAEIKEKILIHHDLTEWPGSFLKILEYISLKRGFLKSGGKADINRSAASLVHELEKGRFGGISLESPPPNPIADHTF